MGERIYTIDRRRPVIIGDGLKGTDDIEVPVEGGEYVKSCKNRTGSYGCRCIYQSDTLQRT